MHKKVKRDKKEAQQRVYVGIWHTMLCICVYVLISAKKGWLCCKSSCHGCPPLHRRAGPLAPRDNHSLAEGHFFFLVSVGAMAGRLAAWHDMVTYLHSWWPFVAPPLPTIRLYAAAYLLSPFAPFRLLGKRACGWGVGTSRLRPVVTFCFCWRGCRSCLVFVA